MNPRQRRRDVALARLYTTTGYTLTEHAMQRATELGYSVVEILACVAKPEQSYPGGPGHPPGRRVLQRGDLTVIIDPHLRHVITVLLRTQANWTHGTHTRRALPAPA